MNFFWGGGQIYKFALKKYVLNVHESGAHGLLPQITCCVCGWPSPNLRAVSYTVVNNAVFQDILVKN